MMKNYLNNFMLDCEYLDSDREFLIKAYEKIANNEKTKKERSHEPEVLLFRLYLVT